MNVWMIGKRVRLFDVRILNCLKIYCEGFGLNKVIKKN